MKRLWIASLLTCGCLSLANNALSIDYTLSPQEFNEDFGSAQPSTLPVVPCASDITCKALPAQANATASCDLGAGKCILTVEVRSPPQTINLTQQSGFPATVANSSAVQDVQVNQVKFWAPTNTLSFNTPPIAVWVGPQSVMKETDAGAVQFGTIPTVAKGQPIQQASAQDVALSDAGKNSLGTFARSFKTPFNVLAVAQIIVHGGDPIPSGRIDLFVQPTVAFKIIPL